MLFWDSLVKTPLNDRLTKPNALTTPAGGASLAGMARGGEVGAFTTAERCKKLVCLRTKLGLAARQPRIHQSRRDRNWAAFQNFGRIASIEMLAKLTNAAKMRSRRD